MVCFSASHTRSLGQAAPDCVVSRIHRDLKSSIAIGSDSPYVSLPIDIQDRNQLKLIPEPSKSTFLPFAKRTVILEICGPGGIGKTTLLNQISEWLATSEEAGI